MKNTALFYATSACDTMMKKYEGAKLPPEGHFYYHQGVFLSGVYKIFQAGKDKKLFEYMKSWVDAVVDDAGVIDVFDKGQLDYCQSGILLFPLLEEQDSMESGEQKYKIAIEKIAQTISEYPVNRVGGFWHNVGCVEQMWLDGLYMAGPFCTMYGKKFDNKDFTELAIRQIFLMREHTKDAETGLWYHAWDPLKKLPWANQKTGLSPEFWGRSVGWVPVAILDMLDNISGTHEKYFEICELVVELISAVCKYQSEDGRWFQVVNKGGQEGNWLENSCSCLFVAAIYKAVRKGILDSQYIEKAKKGYDGIIADLKWEDENLLIGGVCVGTGVGDYEHYCNRPTSTNDLHGVGAFLIMCAEIEEYNQG